MTTNKATQYLFPRCESTRCESRFGALGFITVFLSLLSLFPILSLFASWLQGPGASWNHIGQVLVVPAIFRSAAYATITCIAAAILGTGLAWITATQKFPGRRIFSKLLLLPLALPPYVLGFIYVSLFDFAGPVQSILRQLGIETNFQFRGLWGLCFVSTLSLYPYVYLIVRQGFIAQGRQATLAARSMGHSSWYCFRKIFLPSLLPWIVSSTLLVAMETLADYGTVNIFSYNTLTPTIFRVWHALFDRTSAAQLASAFVAFMLFLLWLESTLANSRKRPTGHGHELRSGDMYEPALLGQVLCMGFCLIVFTLGFALPLVFLLTQVANNPEIFSLAAHFRYAVFSIEAATIVSLLVVLGALCFAAGQRFFAAHRAWRWAHRLARLGYAIPGAVMALAIFSSVFIVKNFLSTVSSSLGLEFSDSTAIVTNGLIYVCLGLFLRFFAVGDSAIGSSASWLPSSLEDAAFSFGHKRSTFIFKIFTPLLRTSIVSAFALCFIDVIKEMPISVMMRGFGSDTLSVHIFEMTSEGEWQRASLSALMMLILGLIPVSVLMLVDRKFKLG